MTAHELNELFEKAKLKPTELKRKLHDMGMIVPDHFIAEISRHRSGKKPISNVWEAFYRSVLN
jgi:hypothetical protein